MILPDKLAEDSKRTLNVVHSMTVEVMASANSL